MKKNERMEGEKKMSQDKIKSGYGIRFNFIKLAPLMAGFSVVGVLLSIGFIFAYGFNFGIDFAGGTEVHIRFQEVMEPETLRTSLSELDLGNYTVQQLGGDGKEFLIRIETPDGQTEREVNQRINETVVMLGAALRTEYPLDDNGILRVDTVGPQIGEELKRNGVLAAFYSFLILLIYIGLRFDYQYAPGAVVCLVHDTLVVLGIFALFQREVNVQIMAAILTLIGYSLNDTIVTFDRIRETLPIFRSKGMPFIINKSINDLLGRTVLTSLTTLIAVSVLYYVAGGVIAEIAFTLFVGVIIGTYSSIYVAAPLVMVAEKWMKK